MSCSGGLYRILKNRLVDKKCYLSKVTFIVSLRVVHRIPRTRDNSLPPRSSRPRLHSHSGDWLSACQKCDIGCGRANTTATMKSFPHPSSHANILSLRRQIFICLEPFLSQFKGTCFAVLTAMSIDAHVLQNHGGQVRLLPRCLIPVGTQRNSQRPKSISQAQRTQVVCSYVVDRLKWLLDGPLKASGILPSINSEWMRGTRHGAVIQ